MSSQDNATGAVETFTYGNDVHGSVSQLLDDAGQVKASYGYDAYGGTDAPTSDPETLTAGDTDAQAPLNPYRYSGRRMDSGMASSTASAVPAASAGYDMGARRFGPDIGRFLQGDMFFGALSDLGLALDPLTQNRYALAGGNPISYVEWDGHYVTLDGYGSGSRAPAPRVTSTSSGGSGGGAVPSGSNLGRVCGNTAALSPHDAAVCSTGARAEEWARSRGMSGFATVDVDLGFGHPRHQPENRIPGGGTGTTEVGYADVIFWGAQNAYVWEVKLNEAGERMKAPLQLGRYIDALTEHLAANNVGMGVQTGANLPRSAGVPSARGPVDVWSEPFTPGAAGVRFYGMTRRRDPDPFDPPILVPPPTNQSSERRERERPQPQPQPNTGWLDPFGGGLFITIDELLSGTLAEDEGTPGFGTDDPFGLDDPLG
jgi:RHS repeat-associated protein